MKIIYISLERWEDFENERKKQFHAYKYSTLLDFLLQFTIDWIHEQDFNKDVTESKYLSHCEKIHVSIQQLYATYTALYGWALLLWKDNLTKSFAELLMENEQTLEYKSFLGFFKLKKSEYIFGNLKNYNKDNYASLELQREILQHIFQKLKGCYEIFSTADFVKEEFIHIGEKSIPIKQKSSIHRYIMSLIQCVRQVRQLRWLAWLEDYVYYQLKEILELIKIPNPKDGRFVIAFPEFFFVDFYDKSTPPIDSRYVKPFYEDVARYFTGLSQNLDRYLTHPLKQHRLSELTLARNVIIFAGTLVWKTKEESTVYTNGRSVRKEEKLGFTKVTTDTFYNTAVVFAAGICHFIWDKQFISDIDGTEGVKVIHKHEEPPEEPSSIYIRSSLSNDFRSTETPFYAYEVMHWNIDDVEISFLLSICCDFDGIRVIQREYCPTPDIQMLIAADAPKRGSECIKSEYFLFLCDSRNLSNWGIYDVKNQKQYDCIVSQNFFNIYECDLPDKKEKKQEHDNAGLQYMVPQNNSFYEKVILQKELTLYDKIDAAALPTENDFVYILETLITKLQIKESGLQSAKGTLELTSGSGKTEFPVIISPHFDKYTKSECVLITLPTSEPNAFSVSEILLFAGNISQGFLSLIKIPNLRPAEFELYFYENTCRRYHLLFKVKEVIFDKKIQPPFKGLIEFKDAKLQVYRDDDVYQYTLSTVIDIAKCPMEFGVVSSSLDLMQAYIRPALPKTKFPSFAIFVKWLFRNDVEDVNDFNSLNEFNLLDLAVSSVTASIKTKDEISFQEVVVGTKITLFSLVFDIDIRVIGKRISGRLENGADKKSVAGIIASVFPKGKPPSIPEPLRTLYIEKVMFDADIKNNSYEFDFGISGSWDCGIIKLDNLQLYLKSDDGEKQIAFYGEFTLFESLNVRVGITEQNEVWSVYGSIAVIDDKSLYDLFNSFGWTSPDIFKNITLSYLSVYYSPAQKEFQFNCSGALLFDNILMKITVSAKKQEGKAVYQGILAFESKTEVESKTEEKKILPPSRFKVDFIDEPNQSKLKITWEQDSVFSITDFCHTIGFETFELPDCINIALSSFGGEFNFSNKAFTLDATTVEGNKLHIKSEVLNKKRQYTFGILLDMNLSLKKLPVVGGSTELMEQIRISKLKAVILSDDNDNLTISEIGIINLQLKRGLYLASNLQLIDKDIPVNLPIPIKARDSNDAVDAEDEEKKGLKINVNKNIGPVSLRKIGASYADKTLWFALDAGFKQNALSFELDELGIGYNIAHKKPSFTLQGMSLDVKTSAVTIGGSFKKTDEHTYRGSLLIRLAVFNLTALGAYTSEPVSSAFVFALLKANIGGPPCFFVTGVAAGFGYNRNLNVPEIGTLNQFPFLKAAKGEITATDIFAEEDTYFPPQSGLNWIVAGILFNSFKMIDSFALLTVKFGSETEVNLLGQSVIDIPYKIATPIVHAVLLLKASFRPSSFVVSIEAALSSESYILSKDCHLTGSFAFYTWYGGSHAGDFVLTLGGYNNIYKKPSHYPVAQRLGLNWQITKNLTAQGGLYFALTPSCIMAGGALKIQFTSSWVEAWFEAHLDILIQWKPYAYDFNVGINIGIKANLRIFVIKLELGCNLHIWGPEFSGTVNVKLWIISFTIPFGASKKPFQTFIDTEDFVVSFLPPSEARKNLEDDASKHYGGCVITANNGLIKEFDIKDDKKGWYICAEQFEIITKSSVPSKTIDFRGTQVYEYSHKTPIIVRPCGDIALDSKQEIVLSRLDGVKITEAFDVIPIEENVPSALWAPPDVTLETIPAGTGVSIKPTPRQYYEFSYKEDVNTVSFNKNLTNAPAIQWKDYNQDKAFDYISKINNAPAQNRAEILSGLGKEFQDIQVETLGKNPSAVFVETPIIATIGGRK